MSTSEKLRALSASAVRAAMLDPTKLAGPRQPKRPLPIVQRLAGGEMLSWCVTTDLRAVLTPILGHPISRPCQRAVERAIVDVKRGNGVGSITLSVGKLMTGVTVREWGAIFMLRSLKANRVTGTSKRTVRRSPGSRSTRA